MRIRLILALAMGFAHADWTPTAGIYGYGVQGLLVQGDTLFAGTVNGLYQSRDDGDHWTASGLHRIARALAVQGNAVLAGTDSGVYRRLAGEAAWTKAQAGLGDTANVALATLGRWTFAGNTLGIFRSGDQGTTWTASITGLYDPHVLCFHVYEGQLYAGTDAGRVFRSEDSGATWATVGPAPLLHVLGVRRLGKRLFIRNLYGIEELAEDASAWDLRFEDKRGANGASLLEVDGDVLFGMGSGGLHRSADSGATWKPVNGSLGTGCEPARLIRKGNRLFAATELGMFRSEDDGRTWAGINRGMAPQIYSTPAALGPRLFAATEKGLFATDDEGESWMRMDTGDQAPSYRAPWYHAIADGGGALWAAYTDGNSVQGAIAMSPDSGRTWAQRPIEKNPYAFWQGIVTLTVQGDKVFAAGDYTSPNPGKLQLYRTTDRGLTWDTCGAGLDYAITGMLSLGDTLFAGTWSGVYRSTDGGTQWKATGAIPRESGVNGIAKLGTTLFAATNRGLYRSRDRGAVWERIDQGGFRDSVLYTAIAAAGRLYVSGWATGIHMSADSGGTWTRLDAPPEALGWQSSFELLAAHGAFLYAGGNGVWKMPLPGGTTPVTPGARTAPVPARGPIRVPGATPLWMRPERPGLGARDAGGRLRAAVPVPPARNGGRP